MTVSKQYDRVAFVASPGAEAQQALEQLTKTYGNHDPDIADVIVALGGDGLMLQTLHRHMRSGKPIYGMHRGTVGFLMNEFSFHGLGERLDAAKVTVIHPLLMRATDVHGNVHIHHAINEVALFDLPHAVILPGLDVVRVGLQRALVPDLRQLVVAELAIGVSDQVGDIGAIVLSQRLQLVDGRRIVVALVDRRIGGPVSLQERGIVEARTLVGLLALLRRLGFGVGGWRRGGVGAGGENGIAQRGCRTQRQNKCSQGQRTCQTCRHACLLLPSTPGHRGNPNRTVVMKTPVGS